MGSITLQKVSKVFGEAKVIPSIDLDIKDGEFVVFVGPSGCGKSTLLRLIAGLEDVSGGKIVIDGRDATEKAPSERGLAMVFQSYALYPHMSVRNNIAFPLKMAGVDKAEIDRKVTDAARVLNLTDYLERKPRQLSSSAPIRSASVPNICSCRWRAVTGRAGWWSPSISAPTPSCISMSTASAW
ncbi:UNVERIFIED_ORG: ABC-type sugar transport system ATPase subunit [Rhizobium etli]